MIEPKRGMKASGAAAFPRPVTESDLQGR